MELLQFVEEIFLAILASTALWVWGKVRKHLKEVSEEASRSEKESVATAAAAVRPAPVQLPPNLSVPGKIEFLERERDEAFRAAVAARSRDLDDREPMERHADICACLRQMEFLQKGDVFEERYKLLTYIGGGRISVVWKAYDERLDCFVAIKFLRYSYIRDESLLEQFQYSARVMHELRTPSIAAVHQVVSELSIKDARKLAYYVLEYIEGISLQHYIERNPGSKGEVINGLLEIGRCIGNSHKKGILHRDIKPSNILVQPGGSLVLVDFDAIIRLSDRHHFIANHEAVTAGYAAPEVLHGLPDLDERADIFALGRVFSFVYYSKRLPSVYERSASDLIELLNCTPTIKKALKKASAVERRNRHRNIQQFLNDLEVAIGEEAPLITLHKERQKVARILRHSFYGTLVFMLIARPIFTHWQAVHLSDRIWVALFHGIIGSLIWGMFISGAFLLYLDLFKKIDKTRVGGYMRAMLCCGIGGFLGGVLCSVPSVFVTNDQTLQCLGWLVGPKGRFSQALLETKMMLSYPLSGFFTGCGLGLCLNRGIVWALRNHPDGSGLLPIPSKEPPRSSLDLYLKIDAVRPLLISWKQHLFLAFPVLFSFVVASILDPAAPDQTTLTTTQLNNCVGFANQPWRSVGEGIVHYLGAIGLTIGFFFGVPMNKTEPETAETAAAAPGGTEPDTTEIGGTEPEHSVLDKTGQT